MATYTKYVMPPDFYKQVLELEREVETAKEHCQAGTLKKLTDLYKGAIEYYGFKDDQTRCQELQMRYQSILVRPYVLDALARVEAEEQKKEAEKPAKKTIVLKSTELWYQKQAEKKQSLMNVDKIKEVREAMAAISSSESESDKEEDEQPEKINSSNANNSNTKQSQNDPEDPSQQSLQNTTNSNANDDAGPNLDENLQVTRQPAKTKVRKARQETKTIKNVEQLEKKRNVMVTQIKNDLEQQTGGLQERLMKRKLANFKKSNQKLTSPNLSKVDTSYMNENDLSGAAEVDQMLANIEGNRFLDDCDSPRGSNEAGSDDEDNIGGKVSGGGLSDEEDSADADEDPELLAELEARQETIIEAFLDIAYESKLDAIEELKLSFKGNKEITREQQKEKVAALTKYMDDRRKSGVKMVKARLALVVDDEEIMLSAKVDKLNDETAYEQMIEMMKQYMSERD